ncbi:MAG: hypothetical protein GC184_13980 [Rhizobiales bacterium]|nr:hypothetical protein [Hyphomicrobiales bacterium]
MVHLRSNKGRAAVAILMGVSLLALESSPAFAERGNRQSQQQSTNNQQQDDNQQRAERRAEREAQRAQQQNERQQRQQRQQAQTNQAQQRAEQKAQREAKQNQRAQRQDNRQDRRDDRLNNTQQARQDNRQDRRDDRRDNTQQARRDNRQDRRDDRYATGSYASLAGRQAAPIHQRHVNRDVRRDRRHADWSDRGWLPSRVIYRNSYYYVSTPRPNVYVAPSNYYDYDTYDSYYTNSYGRSRPSCNSDAVGAFIGGILGGVIGANEGHGRGAIGGVIIGSLLGGVLGAAIDSSNQACIGEVLEYGPTDETVSWDDPDTGGYYEVTPTRTYSRGGDIYCREYQTYVEIDGRTQSAYGEACRQPDGAWKQVPYRG